MIYSIGLFYLPASTYSLICATQTAFNAVFSHLISSKKFTALILNSGCPLIFISHIVVNDDSDGLSGASKWQYIIGFLYTLRAFALHSLSLSLMHLSLPKGSKKGIFSGSGNANLYSTCCHLCFYCGKWKTFCMGMVGFAGGRVSCVMT